MGKFPKDASRSRVFAALEALGFQIVREREHIAMVRENADGTKTPLTLPNHNTIKSSGTPPLRAGFGYARASGQGPAFGEATLVIETGALSGSSSNPVFSHFWPLLPRAKNRKPCFSRSSSPPIPSHHPAMASKRFSEISRHEAARAFYVDCEGFADKPPSLIGILCEDDFRQVVLDPALAPAAIAKKLDVCSLGDVITDLIHRCRAEGRLLVGYSLHELELFRNYADVDCSAVYRDAKRIATRWWNRTHPDARRQDRSLKSFLHDIAYEYPHWLGIQKAASRLRDVLNGIMRYTHYEDLTTTMKGKWTKLLRYNWHDCDGMRALVMHALR